MPKKPRCSFDSIISKAKKRRVPPANARSSRAARFLCRDESLRRAPVACHQNEVWTNATQRFMVVCGKITFETVYRLKPCSTSNTTLDYVTMCICYWQEHVFDPQSSANFHEEKIVLRVQFQQRVWQLWYGARLSTCINPFQKVCKIKSSGIVLPKDGKWWKVESKWKHKNKVSGEAESNIKLALSSSPPSKLWETTFLVHMN